MRRDAAWLGLALLVTAGASAQPAADAVDVLSRARLVRASSASDAPPADKRADTVTLPHAEAESAPSREPIAWYSLQWTLPRTEGSPYAVYVTTTVPVRVYVNGSLVGATGPLGGPRPRSYDQSQSFDVPPSLLRPGVNAVDLEANAGMPGMALDAVIAGPGKLVQSYVMRDLLVHTVGPAFVSVTTIVVGLFILALWARRRERPYAMFGIASVLWGLHTLVSLLPTPPLPQPHYTIWWHAVYMTFVVMLSLFCADFAGFASRMFERAGIAFALLVAPALYAADAFGALAPAAVALRAIGILFVLVALGAVARYALRARNLESALFLITGGISAAFAIHDWVVANDPLAVRPVWLVPYAALFFLTLVGWILVDRFVQARNAAERVAEELERRVAEKSAALTAQLARTDEARRAALVAQQLAEAADRAKSRFLAAASHDLRQPLHALGLFGTALKERALDPETAVLASRINTSVESLETLFSALLDISRLDAGVVTATPRDILLEPLFERLANDFSAEAAEKSLRLAILPTGRAVRSDPVLLERVLRNLVANALRYTASGGIVLAARPRGERVSIEVWDSGPGIADGDRDRIFEEFCQVGNPERDRARGLGLGLAIVRRLVDLLGHEIRLDSRVGRGSVFRVLVPRADAARLGEAGAGATAIRGTLAGARVLVVDDDPAVREGMCRALDAWGCASEAVGAPEEVGFGAGVPDAMLVDYRLREGLDGLRAIALLRQRFERDIPAIIVSGESLPEELARIDGTGILMLHKPVPPAKLRAALLHVLAQRTATAAA